MEWYAYHLIRNLAKIDRVNKYKLYSPVPLDSGLLDLGENFQEVILKWPFKYMWMQVCLSLEMLKNPPDVLFVPAQPLPLICPKKTINSIHDLGFTRFPEVYTKRQLTYLQYHAKTSSKKAAKIITISDFTKQELVEKYGYQEKNIVVTHLGYDPQIYRPIEDERLINRVREKYSIKKDFLLCLGRIEKKKNILTLIKALEALLDDDRKLADNLELVLVGKPGYGYQEIKEEIKNSKIKNNIREIGWVEEGIVPLLMNAAKVFIFPSLYEGFGLPLVQAMACATPIVASDIPTTHEICKDSCLYFQPNSAFDLKQQIAEILEKPKTKEPMIKKGLEQCKEFSWESTAKQTLDVINNI